MNVKLGFQSMYSLFILSAVNSRLDLSEVLLQHSFKSHPTELQTLLSQLSKDSNLLNIEDKNIIALTAGSFEYYYGSISHNILAV